MGPTVNLYGGASRREVYGDVQKFKTPFKFLSAGFSSHRRSVWIALPEMDSSSGRRLPGNSFAFRLRAVAAEHKRACAQES